ncbi:MAG: aldo/keto reductase [bacterium]|nr:aldo/keto reductase [bacterium]
MVAYYNPIEMEMAEFFPEMASRGQGFFCLRPFMGGLLTDRRVDRSSLPVDDRFRHGDWDAAYEQFGMLQADLGTEVSSWTDFVIKFGLCHPLVTSLIVGLNSIEQVDGVLDAADGNYPDRSVFARALEIFRSIGA